MERLGFIRSLVTRKQEIAGAEYYDMVMVTGYGLTAEGKQMLDRAIDEEWVVALTSDGS